MIYKNLNFLIKSKSISIADLSSLLYTNDSAIKKILTAKQELTYAQIIAISAFTNLSFDQLSATSLANNLKNKIIAKKIKMLVLDVDGVLTDGGMYYTENGDEFKKFNTKDGLAIRALTKKGFLVGIISNGINKKLITSRAKLLGIQHVYVGTEEKEKVLNAWCKKIKIDKSTVAYIGDDLNDVSIMSQVGLSACPSNAVNAVKIKVHIVLNNRGGNACVREFCDTYLL